jgi:outer membrane protein OmpA-like peptidoglycan-associated protein/tetratricopeptide (TPR) repeat protein
MLQGPASVFRCFGRRCSGISYIDALKDFALWGVMVLLLQACVSTGRLPDGDTAYRLGKYAVAVEMLQEEYPDERNPLLKAEKAYRIASAYEAMGKPSAAERWFGKAYADGYGPDALYAQAQQRKQLEDYDGAIQVLEDYLLEAPEYRSEIKREIAACRRAKSWLNGVTYYSVSALEALNSPSSDYGPVWLDERTLLFTSDRQGSEGEADNEWTGGLYYDLYQSTRSASGWSEPIPYNETINEGYHESSPAFSPRGDELVYTQCGSAEKETDDACRLLYRYRVSAGAWSEPIELMLFGDSVNLGHPSWSADGQRLYFAASGDPESYGGADLYYAQLTDAGWGSPINLGPTVNTSGNEVFPHAGADGTLYFASDGHPGMGGLDLFKTIQNKRKWQRPEAFGYPVNSGADDFGLVLDPRQSTHPDTLLAGVFSSARADGRGSDDLYRFVLEKAPPPPPVYWLEGDVVQAIALEVTDSVVAGPDTLPDVRYAPLRNATVELNDASAFQSEGALDLDRLARFRVQLAPATDYRLKASMDGFFNREETVSTIGMPETPGDTFVIEKRIVLEQLPAPNSDITLQNIYYDFDDTTIRAESGPELDKLVKLLAENPTLKVEIGSHTDARGAKDYNQRLSRGRANSVVAYLVDRGIPDLRMVARGYGETRILNRCRDGVECTEEEHQLNRRTTFKVLGEIELESLPPDKVRVDPRRRGR